MGGRHQGLNAAAALAVADYAGIPLQQGADALGGVAVEHRLHETETPSGVIVVDDSYNASPESMLAAFEAVAERAHAGRLLAVLGQMSELGQFADAAHRDIGAAAARTFDETVVVDTRLGRILAEGAQAEVVADNAAAAAWVRKHARAGDRVLIKASHGLRLDEVVSELTRP